jgi:DNA-binding NarL/FixJ family response regulator
VKAGAQGYILKESAGKELVAAVRALYKGGQYFSLRIEFDTKIG